MSEKGSNDFRVSVKGRAQCWTGVFVLGGKVVWQCGHKHRCRYISSIMQTSAIDCARAEFEHLIGADRFHEYKFGRFVPTEQESQLLSQPPCLMAVHIKHIETARDIVSFLSGVLGRSGEYTGLNARHCKEIAAELEAWIAEHASKEPVLHQSTESKP